jgi:hypothetical protein
MTLIEEKGGVSIPSTSSKKCKGRNRTILYEHKA